MQSIHKVRSCLFRKLQKQMRFNTQVSRTRPCLSCINGVGTLEQNKGGPAVPTLPLAVRYIQDACKRLIALR